MEGKILVTGATGTIGSEVIKQLSSKQADIRAAVHSISKAGKLKEDNVQVVELDFNKPETFEAALKGIEKVIDKEIICPICQTQFRLKKDPKASSEIHCPSCGIPGEITIRM